MAEPARYVLGELLGEGGFALVYRAWDAVLRREVALKQLRPELCRDDRTRRRFRREAQRLARLDHPSLVPVHDVGELNGQPFFTMRLINGVRLTDIELAESPLPVARAVLLLGEVAADRGGSLKQTQQRHKTVFAPPKTHTSVRQVRAMESFQECVAAKPRGDVLVDYPKPDDERSQGGNVVPQPAAAPRDFAPVQSRHPDPEQVAELIA